MPHRFIPWSARTLMLLAVGLLSRAASAEFPVEVQPADPKATINPMRVPH